MSRRQAPANRGKAGSPRTTRGQFPPGVSGNPSGRPAGSAGIAARIREHCGDDLATLVDAWMCVAFGNAADRRAFFGEPVNVTAKDRLFALAELRDTAIGRPHQSLAVGGGVAGMAPLQIILQPPPPGYKSRSLPSAASPAEPLRSRAPVEAGAEPHEPTNDNGNRNAQQPPSVPDLTYRARRYS